MSRVNIQPAALVDIDSAAAEYENKQPGLGIEFILEFDATIERIASYPRSYSIQYRDARRALLRRFPYAVYFIFSGNNAEVFAVLHQHQEPSAWQSRA